MPHCRRVVVAALLAVSVGGSVAGCGDDTADDAAGGGVDWAASSDAVATTGLVYAVDGVVHLGDGSTLDAGTDIERYVVAGDGAYVVPKTPKSTRSNAALLRVTPDDVEETGARLVPDSLRASPDGRYLAFLDAVSGPQKTNDDPLMQVVVVDLRAGREIVRTSEGMGDPDTDDLRDLYEDSEPGVLGVSDETAWFDTPDGVLSVALADADVTVADVADVFDTTQPWFTPHYEDDLNGGPWNPAHTWAIDTREPRDRFVAEGGTVLDPVTGTPTWSLGRWLDDSTAVGLAVDAPPDNGFLDQEASRTLITCTVPDGACAPVAGTTGPPGTVLLPVESLIGG